MAALDSIVGSSLKYRLSWCENHYADRYYCEWRVDPCLVIVVASGDRHRLFVASDDGDQCFEAVDNEALLIPAGVKHRFESEAGHICGVNVQFTLLGGVDVLSFYRVPHYLNGEPARQIGQRIAALVELIGRRSALYPVAAKGSDAPLNLSTVFKERSLIFDLLALLLDNSTELGEGGQRLLVMQKLRPALEHIDSFLGKKLAVEDLADLCELSPHRFSSVFKQITGQSPHHYILEKRVASAMDLLTHSEKSVAEIATELGFHDQPHFTKQFKNITNLSPNYYRKEVRRRIIRQDSNSDSTR